jgi:hypothetical protein
VVTPLISSSQRARLWRSLGASLAETEELLGYAAAPFDFSRLPARYPLADEPFVAAWQSYLAPASEQGVFACLRQRLLQLRFPIAAGISETDIYQAVTRRGELTDERLGDLSLALHRADCLMLSIRETAAGCVPVLAVGVRQDFEALVQALTRRNEPWPVPRSMGACIVTGYNNWGRIFELRRQWEEAAPEPPSPEQWKVKFREVAAQPDLYQDRFILVSAGPYSAQRADELGLTEEDWALRSSKIRIEHECTHYFTLRVLGSMRNALPDEIIADYMGIVACESSYRRDWLLRFLGLESFPRYRPGARLENYRGDPPLTDGAFTVLAAAAHRAAHNLERIHELRPPAPHTAAEKAETIIALCLMGMEGLASREAAQLFARALVTIGGGVTPRARGPRWA